MTKKILTILAILSFNIGFGQVLSVVGTWKLVKHITTFNDNKNYDCMKLMEGSTQEWKINKDGTYEQIWTDKTGKKQCTIGKWKMSADNKKLTCYNNDFKPKIPNNTIADRTHDIPKLTATEFEFKDNLCTEGEEGVSLYTRIK